MDLHNWHEQNNAYLSTSLHWLRLKLERSIQVQRADAPGPRTAPEPSRESQTGVETRHKSSLINRFFGAGDEPGARASQPAQAIDTAGPLLEPPNIDQRIKQAEAERDAAAAMQPPPALLTLADRLRLNPFERDALLLCTAMELDPSLPGLCAKAQDQPNKPYPTFALALSTFDAPVWDALSPHGPLRYWRLIEINQPGATPLTQSALRADERIVNTIKGLNALDDRLTAYCTYAPIESPRLSQTQRHAADEIAWQWQRVGDGEALPLAQLIGGDATGKQLVAREAALALGRQLLVMQADALPSQITDVEWLARLWQRECLLLPLALYIEATHAGVEAQTQFGRFIARAAQASGAVLIGARDPLPQIDVRAFSIDVGKPALAEQREAWMGVLDNNPLADRLASQFSLNLPDIHDIGQDAVSDAHDASEQSESEARTWDICNARIRPRLDALAQRLDAKAMWDDLVLAEEPLALLKRIAAQVRQRARVYEDFGFGQRMNRGFGISALFAGESGTGKTMAAEVIANDLQLNLYRIDLSAVVSKYIGETEKNLRRLFDAAEDGGAILFFDEADALFGKRSEVKDSHDRYANIEINYLLQRMEAYSGLAILATNMKSALDAAFMRRLRFVVNFAFPGTAKRKAMWQKAFPAQLPVADLDWDRLAKLNLTGGNIHNIALNAAFLAAEAHAPLSMAMVLDAARMELRKLDKPFSEADVKV